MDSFEITLSVLLEELEIELRSFGFVPWLNFELNPRRLRGSDFLMRWSQGVWSEKRLMQAVQDTREFFALPYGPSGTAPDDDPRAYELYFERLDRASTAGQKRPDILIFRNADKGAVQQVVAEIGGNAELPFTPQEDKRIRKILASALLAVECENSLWRATQMPDYGTSLAPQRWLGGKPGLRKTAVVPTVILKEEDREPLRNWQRASRIPLHIWHVFYDLAFGISFDTAERLIETGEISPTDQVFQAPGGATTKKTIYKIYYQHAYPVGEATSEPQLVADYIADKNGHILPYVRFEGGRLKLSPDALMLLRGLPHPRGN